MKCRVFHSNDVDSKDAMLEVIKQIEENFTQAPDALIVEAGISHDHDALISTLSKKYPKAAIVGGTTDGEIFQGHFQTDSIVVAAIEAGKNVQITAACVPNITPDTMGSKMKTALSAAKAATKAPIKFALSWVEGLPGFDPGLSPQEFYKHIDGSVPVFGGSTGDYLKMKGTRQYFGSQVLQQSIVYLLFAGDVQFASSLDSGWTPIGDKHVITGADANILKEIDGRPAAEVIKQYTGSVENLCKNPFAIYDNDAEFYMLSGMSLTPEGHVFMAGTVPVGKQARFTEVTVNKLVDAAGRVVADLATRVTKAPSCLFVFSCSARRQLLGTSVDRELAPAVLKFPNVPIIGQYCYGEFGPYKGKTSSRMHNNTCIVLAVA
jgi:hypothetical protein